MAAPKTEPFSQLLKTLERDRERCFFRLANVVAFAKYCGLVEEEDMEAEDIAADGSID